MWLIANDRIRLTTISSPMSVLNGLTPRERSSTAAAPIRPNTAPDAPTVSASGVTINAPSAPANKETK